jgi:hypothetical protein
VKKKSDKKSMAKKVSSHLKEDVKGYEKERKYLKKEIQEDKELARSLKKKK